MSLSNVESQAAEDIERQQRRARRVRNLTNRFRVLIIGRANAGKTTILQRVCNTTEQPKIFNPEGHEIDLSELNPTAQRGEHDIENEMIFESNTAFVFHDSRGFEAGRTSELDKVKEFLQKRSTNNWLEDHLHVIWYCIPINDEARPFTRAELTFFDECGTGRVPVIVLFTKADMLDAQTIKHLVDTGMDVEDAANKAPEELVARFEEKFGKQLFKRKYPPKDHVYFRDMQNPTSDCSELLRKTAATFSDDTLLQLFLTVQQNNVALSIEYAIKRITELSFQIGSYSKKRESGGRWLRRY
ncbi:small GTP-binding protein domain [Laccaria bicolor S238N-H82]|uniref:Small GTP-binding protein domain n=1 Tax=Laccaria bicolor (strain S238N-H82 / ATCC MYA-4686) TaxID=486041 RepID=B0D5W1_LACBS|nr:small GTP-binding protein domain [Laccaria bicolor S238N-H82]EDR10089.1 small GTP-binding protein domain [Laccaria bicolor S238N-H82]|eukprot:XP_001879474.1 small GTP-binding protein domain [Laccaria bicolor S238N-H82]